MNRGGEGRRPVRRYALGVLASIGWDIRYGPWYDRAFWLAFPGYIVLSLVIWAWDGAPLALLGARGVLSILTFVAVIGWIGAGALRYLRSWRAESHARKLALVEACAEGDWAAYEQQVVGKLNALADLRATLHGMGASAEALDAVEAAREQAVNEYGAACRARTAHGQNELERSADG